MKEVLTMLSVFSIDQGVKGWIENRLQQGEILPGTGDKIRIRRLHNQGMAMGKGSEYPSMIAFLSLVVTLLFGIAMAAKKKKLEPKGIHAVKRISMAVFFGGACSNTYDRVCRGHVVDYVSLRTGKKSVDKVVFNLADVAIVLGALVFAVADFFTPQTKKK